jgi:tetratricopeptide (TPR) repeat protein/membrane protease YdiL (CAAX protease family)
LQTFYDRFKNLSDEELFQRIDQKDHFQKEAVLAAYNILLQRGYELEYPFPRSVPVNEDKSEIKKKSSFLEREYHEWFKLISTKRSFGLLIIFFLIFAPLLWYSNSYLSETSLYRQLHLFSQTIIPHGGINYIIEIALVFAFFLNSKKRRDTFLIVKSNHIATAVKVFVISLVIISVWEWLFSSRVTVTLIADDKTGRELLKNFWFGGLVAFTEELIFKWLLLTQLLLRTGNSRGKRRLIFFVVAILFAAAHIPIQINEYGGISTAHLIMTFLYSYFTSILYVKHKNLLLVVLLHFFMNISNIFVDDGYTFFFNWSTILLGIYCIPKINNGWIFRSSHRFNLPKWGFASLILLITSIILISPKQPKDLYNYSRQYYFMDSYNQAMNLINAAISKEENRAEFLNHRGNIFYSIDKYDSAWLDYDQAVKIDNNFHGAIRNRGLAAKQISKYQECIEDLTIAVINDIQTSQVYQNRGSCYIGISEPALAISDFEQSLKRNSSNDQAYYGLGKAYLKLKEFEKSSKNLELAITLDPNFIQAYELLAMAYMGLGRYDSSNVVMTKAIEMGSSNPIRFYLRGLNYYEKKDYHNAVKEFEKSIEFNPEEPELYLNLAYSYFLIENFAKGCEYLNKSAWLGNEQAKADLSSYCEKSP